jgi:hypothetical protein
MIDAGFVQLVATLRQLRTPPVARRPGECCELCGVSLSDRHRHVVDMRTRRLLCACAMCGTAGGRYRAVPIRYAHLPSMKITQAQWDALGIPVDLAFLFFNSALGRTVACYPGPAGAAESLLPLDAWPAVVDANPWIRTVAPDVEALLVRRHEGEYTCFVVPIDACYELVGRIRTEWTGFGGGDKVRDAIDSFFATVLDRSART